LKSLYGHIERINTTKKIKEAAIIAVLANIYKASAGHTVRGKTKRKIKEALLADKGERWNQFQPSY
jgi:hypothetical protein